MELIVVLYNIRLSVSQWEIKQDFFLIVFTLGGQLRAFLVPAEDLAHLLFWPQCGESVMKVKVKLEFSTCGWLGSVFAFDTKPRQSQSENLLMLFLGKVTLNIS